MTSQEGNPVQDLIEKVIKDVRIERVNGRLFGNSEDAAVAEIIDRITNSKLPSDLGLSRTETPMISPFDLCKVWEFAAKQYFKLRLRNK